jgi:predicted RNA-binding protein with PUA domain
VAVIQIVTETIPRRSHYWWCTDCELTGPREERLDFAFNGLRTHQKVTHA